MGGLIEDVMKDPDEYQVGGDHYQKKIEPWDIIEAYGLDFWEGNVVKYILRWRQPGGDGSVDLEKCMHYASKVMKRYKEGKYGTTKV